MSQQRILITGGFGAIGVNLLAALRTDPELEVCVVDDFSSGIVNYAPQVQFTHLDIANAERVAGFFRDHQPDQIYHLAAHFANQNSVDHPVSDTMTNVVGTINLLEAQRANPRLKKFVFASSSCVYGNSDEMTETAGITPYETPYAINKYVGELYCRYYAEVHAVPTVCARIFNTYGPGELPGRYRNVVPNFVARALRDEEIVITGTGDETRDFTFVSDTVELLRQLAASTFLRGEVFNGGTGHKTRIRDLAELIISATGSRSQVRYAARRSWDHVADRCADTRKSREILGYAPKVELRDGLVRTVEWLRPRIRLNS
jgi:nucleoside-diphosphate-sugar epimerase